VQREHHVAQRVVVQQTCLKLLPAWQIPGRQKEKEQAVVFRPHRAQQRHIQQHPGHAQSATAIDRMQIKLSTNEQAEGHYTRPATHHP
jgi:hypothetical protein